MINVKELKCLNCGASLTPYFSLHRAVCDYCGSNYFMEGEERNIETLNDAPVKVHLVRDEMDTNIYLGGIGELCFVAGLSHELKVNYTIEPIWDRGKSSVVSKIGPFTCHEDKYAVNIEIDKRKWKSLVRERNYNMKLFDYHGEPEMPVTNQAFKQEVEKWKKRSYENIKNVENQIHKWELRGAKVSVSRKTYSYDEKSWDSHDLEISFPIITEKFYPQFFPDYYHRYNQIKDNNKLDMIADIICKHLENKEQYKNSDPVYHVSNTGVTFRMAGGEASPGIRLDFHQIGMEYPTDSLTSMAITLAVAVRFLNNTKRNNKYLLGLRPHIEDFWEEIDTIGVTHHLLPGYAFRILEKSVKEYQKW